MRDQHCGPHLDESLVKRRPTGLSLVFDGQQLISTVQRVGHLSTFFLSSDT